MIYMYNSLYNRRSVEAGSNPQLERSEYSEGIWHIVLLCVTRCPFRKQYLYCRNCKDMRWDDLKIEPLGMTLMWCEWRPGKACMYSPADCILNSNGVAKMLYELRTRTNALDICAICSQQFAMSPSHPIPVVDWWIDYDEIYFKTAFCSYLA